MIALDNLAGLSLAEKSKVDRVLLVLYTWYQDYENTKFPELEEIVYGDSPYSLPFLEPFIESFENKYTIGELVRDEVTQLFFENFNILSEAMIHDCQLLMNLTDHVYVSEGVLYNSPFRKVW